MKESAAIDKSVLLILL